MPAFDQSGGFQLGVGYYVDAAEPCVDPCPGLSVVNCDAQYGRCSWTGSACVHLCTTYSGQECAAVYGCSLDQGVCRFDPVGPACVSPPLTVDFAGQRIQAYTTDRSTCGLLTACLGERAYGGAKQLRVEVEASQACASGATDAVRPARLAFVDIEPSNACPRPGLVDNGEFSRSQQGGPPAAFSIGPGGEGGSSAAHFAITTRCGRISTSQSYSVPTALASPALELWRSPGAGMSGTVFLGQTLSPVALPAATGTGKTRICLPSAERGFANQASITMSGPGDSLPGAPSNCDDAFLSETIVDSVRLVSDPRCLDNANLQNGTFESTAEGLVTWSPAKQLLIAGDLEPTVEVLRTGAGHGGSASAGHIVLAGCGSAQLTTNVTLPAPVGGWGGALRFFYKLSLGTGTFASATVQAASGFGLTAAAGWTEKLVCLSGSPSTAAGLSFGVFRYSDCGASFPDELWIDDVELVNDPSCPP